MPTRVSTPVPLRRPARWILLGIVATAGLLALSSDPSSAASSNIVVSMSIPSATAVDTVACGAGPATSFGTVLPGTFAITTADCRIRFGSSNDSSSLRIAQSDGSGTTMWRPSLGAAEGSFGTSGAATRNVNTDDRVIGAAIALDGSVIVAVDTSVGANVRLVRFDPSGTYDAAFGIQTLQLGDSYFGRVGVAVLPDGRILVAGTTPTQDVAVERRLATGGIDTTFGGGDGLADLNTSTVAADDEAYAIVVLASGAIVAAGWTEVGGGAVDAVLVRLTATGLPDDTFGGGDAIATFDFGGSDDGVQGIVEQPDGKLVLAGWTSSPDFDSVIARLLADGTKDLPFGGGDAWWRNSIAGGQESGGVAMHPGGGIAFTIQASDGTLRLGRLLADGSGLDPAFAGGTLVTPSVTGGDYTIGSRAPLVQPDGMVVVPGYLTSGDADAALARYRSDGSADPTFGTAGLASLDAAAGVADQASYVLAGPDGRLRFAGMRGAAGSRDVTVGSMSALAMPDYDDAGGVDWSNPTAEFFGACLVDASVGAVGSWTEAGTCSNVDGTAWNDVPVATETVATAASATTTALADFRFAVKVGTARPAGTYIAPLTFTVVAPAV